MDLAVCESLRQSFKTRFGIDCVLTDSRIWVAYTVRDTIDTLAAMYREQCGKWPEGYIK